MPDPTPQWTTTPKETKLYEDLGVKPGASTEDLTAAFRKAAREGHPDRTAGNPTAQKRFLDAKSAFEILRDPEKRALYDKEGQAGLDKAAKEQAKQQRREAKRAVEEERRQQEAQRKAAQEAAEQRAREAREKADRDEAARQEEYRRQAEERAKQQKAEADQRAKEEAARKANAEKQKPKGGWEPATSDKPETKGQPVARLEMTVEDAVNGRVDRLADALRKQGLAVEIRISTDNKPVIEIQPASMEAFRQIQQKQQEAQQKQQAPAPGNTKDASAGAEPVKGRAIDIAIKQLVKEGKVVTYLNSDGKPAFAIVGDSKTLNYVKTLLGQTAGVEASGPFGPDNNARIFIKPETVGNFTNLLEGSNGIMPETLPRAPWPDDKPKAKASATPESPPKPKADQPPKEGQQAPKEPTLADRLKAEFDKNGILYDKALDHPEALLRDALQKNNLLNLQTAVTSNSELVEAIRNSNVSEALKAMAGVKANDKQQAADAAPADKEQKPSSRVAKEGKAASANSEAARKLRAEIDKLVITDRIASVVQGEGLGVEKAAGFFVGAQSKEEFEKLSKLLNDNGIKGTRARDYFNEKARKAGKAEAFPENNWEIYLTPADVAQLWTKVGVPPKYFTELLPEVAQHPGFPPPPDALAEALMAKRLAVVTRTEANGSTSQLRAFEGTPEELRSLAEYFGHFNPPIQVEITEKGLVITNAAQSDWVDQTLLNDPHYRRIRERTAAVEKVNDPAQATPERPAPGEKAQPDASPGTTEKAATDGGPAKADTASKGKPHDKKGRTWQEVNRGKDGMKVARLEVTEEEFANGKASRIAQELQTKGIRVATVEKGGKKFLEIQPESMEAFRSMQQQQAAERSSQPKPGEKPWEKKHNAYPEAGEKRNTDAYDDEKRGPHRDQGPADEERGPGRRRLLDKLARKLGKKPGAQDADPVSPDKATPPPEPGPGTEQAAKHQVAKEQTGGKKPEKVAQEPVGAKPEKPAPAGKAVEAGNEVIGKYVLAKSGLHIVQAVANGEKVDATEATMFGASVGVEAAGAVAARLEKTGAKILASAGEDAAFLARGTSLAGRAKVLAGVAHGVGTTLGVVSVAMDLDAASSADSTVSKSAHLTSAGAGVGMLLVASGPVGLGLLATGVVASEVAQFNDAYMPAYRRQKEEDKRIHGAGTTGTFLGNLPDTDCRRLMPVWDEHGFPNKGEYEQLDFVRSRLAAEQTDPKKAAEILQETDPDKLRSLVTARIKEMEDQYGPGIKEEGASFGEVVFTGDKGNGEKYQGNPRQYYVKFQGALEELGATNDPNGRFKDKRHPEKDIPTYASRVVQAKQVEAKYPEQAAQLKAYFERMNDTVHLAQEGKLTPERQEQEIRADLEKLDKEFDKVVAMSPKERKEYLERNEAFLRESGIGSGSPLAQSMLTYDNLLSKAAVLGVRSDELIRMGLAADVSRAETRKQTNMYTATGAVHKDVAEQVGPNERTGAGYRYIDPHGEILKAASRLARAELGDKAADKLVEEVANEKIRRADQYMKDHQLFETKYSPAMQKELTAKMNSDADGILVASHIAPVRAAAVKLTRAEMGIGDDETLTEAQQRDFDAAVNAKLAEAGNAILGSLNVKKTAEGIHDLEAQGIDEEALARAAQSLGLADGMNELAEQVGHHEHRPAHPSGENLWKEYKTAKEDAVEKQAAALERAQPQLFSAAISYVEAHGGTGLSDKDKRAQAGQLVLLARQGAKTGDAKVIPDDKDGTLVKLAQVVLKEEAQDRALEAGLRVNGEVLQRLEAAQQALDAAKREVGVPVDETKTSQQKALDALNNVSDPSGKKYSESVPKDDAGKVDATKATAAAGRIAEDLETQVQTLKDITKRAEETAKTMYPDAKDKGKRDAFVKKQTALLAKYYLANPSKDRGGAIKQYQDKVLVDATKISMAMEAEKIKDAFLDMQISMAPDRDSVFNLWDQKDKHETETAGKLEAMGTKFSENVLSQLKGLDLTAFAALSKPEDVGFDPTGPGTFGASPGVQKAAKKAR
jgi:curved DNA-binding protein CbpA